MALVSPSPPPSGSLYPPAAPLYARASTDSPPTLVRALPMIPGSSSAGTSETASRTGATGMNAGSTTRREGSGGSGAGGLAGGSVAGGIASTRSGGSFQPPRARTANAPRPDASASSSSRSLAANDGLTPLLPTPSRASSTPPTSVGSSFVGRTSSSSSLRGDGHVHSASVSAASSSLSFSTPNVPALPRLAPAHLGGGHHSPNLTSSPQSYFPPTSQPYPQGSYMAQVALPPFQGQPFLHAAQGHPNPAYPFIPSPHPNAHGGMPAFAYNGANGFVIPNGGQLSPDQQKRLQHYQQQWQMEMIKHQQDGQARRRATSGPAPSHSHSSSFNSSALPYPPSPSPSLHQQPFQHGGMAPPVPNLPPGAMLPQFGVHGYPTPPGSTEGAARAGGDSSGSSNGSSARGGDAAYHPYRRHHTDGSRSSSHRATSSNGSTASSARASVAAQKHGRNESSVSLAQLAQENYGPPTVPHQFPRTSSSSSVNSQGRSSPPIGRNAPLPQAQAPPSFPRPRTESGHSSASSRSDPHTRPSSSLRTNSFDTARSATPVQARSRPSPLSSGPAHDDSSDDGADSDGTAEATATISTAQVVPRPAAPVAAPAPAPAKEREKEKKGMKSRFKKAFGVSNSASSSTLTEAELDGRGPKQLNGGLRARRDSSSSSEGEAAASPKVPYATHQSPASVASSAASTLGDGASMTTSRKPPSSRFRLMNGKFNSSSDNLSISSTVSSASVMIRKLGQMGKLARRNSLMGLTKAFKKDKGKDDESAVERDVNGGRFLGGKKDKKKAGAADASVSHATAEYDFSSAQSSTMSPAAALARKQQLAYAEQEAAEERARQAAAEEAARLGPPRSFEQLPAHARTESSASDASSVRKDKPRKGLGLRGRLGFGGSKTDLRETTSVNDDAATGRGGSALGHYDDTTPRGSLEILAPPNKPYATYDRDPGQDSEEYEPSLYREGAVPRRGPVRPVKGILKGAGSYRQEDFAAPRAPFIRNRASSFDAPQQHGRPGSPGNAALVNTIPSEQQVDGVAPMSPRHDVHAPSPTELIHESAAARVHPETTASGPYSNPGLNASAPVLNHFTFSPSMRPAPQASTGRRRIAFATNLSVHTTWPATIYDRRAEPATCNRLTPLLAQQIKEELNSFKMEEMDVHPMSRRLTHFFV
ncbi:hypothetical protein Rt10032_c11g4640 [Rhodotorula toruloides]|uniref:Uncharacterized protein n=1 Tax=Rhodotorula toruloides TaxID=5286 RepID=A0A511KJT3_RHOTO|nr:hypothetical protein Rt10032_c11g4640 [Rhodotorula toruloides]